MNISGLITMRHCSGSEAAITVIVDSDHPERRGPVDVPVVLSLRILGVREEFIRELLKGSRHNISVDIL